MTATTDTAPASPEVLRFERAAPGSVHPSSSDSGIRVLTPADIASWAAGLGKRTELCLAIAGTPRGKLTLYAGPDDRDAPPVAILTGLTSGTYVSRPWSPDIQEWMTSILHAANTLQDSGQPQ